MRTIELPDRLYDNLVATAQSRGQSPAEWIAEHLLTLAQPPFSISRVDRDMANTRLRATCITAESTGVDEESLQRDLVRAYSGELDESHS